MSTPADRMPRRTFLQSAAGLGVLGALGAPAVRGQAPAPHVAVVGAGALGGWTALHLLRRGARVTLLDAWGPGNTRASSGGETRVIRHAYTTRRYVDLTARSLALYRESSARWQVPLFHQTGVLFMAPEGNDFVATAAGHMRAAGIAHEVWDAEQIARRYPQMNPEGLAAGTWEAQAGYLLARRACAAVAEAVVREGGTYRTAAVTPGAVKDGVQDGEMAPLRLSDGSTLAADYYVFACGPWLGRLFPDAVGHLVVPTRQEVFYFGAPAGDVRFGEDAFPVWADMGSPVWYGIPGNEYRGFKIADDTRGPAFDPTGGERTPSAEALAAARAYVARRFPALAGAPLVESRVCQYEQTPDGNLIVDRHPAAGNVWLVGGGSGHGFKLGPAVGELAAAHVLDGTTAEPLFALARFGAAEKR